MAMGSNLLQSADIGNGDEAAAFVESVMLSQRVTRVGSPNITSSKKRPANSPVELEDSPVKKPRQSAKRTLYDIQPTPPTPAPRRSANKVVITQADIHVDGDVTVEQLVRKMSADMHMLFTSLSERVDKLEATLEQRISSKVSQLLDKRVNTELNRIRRDVDDKMDDFKETMRLDVTEEITELKAKVDSLADNRPTSDNDISRNIIIRGLSEIHNENTVSRVNTLVKDVLKLHGITCESAERKISSNQYYPGIIVARMKSMEDKRKVMAKKPELQRNQQFSKVFIDHDLSYADRVMSGNFRAVLKALNNQGLTMKGSRVIRSRDGSDDVSGRGGYQRPPQTEQRPVDRDSQRGNGRQNSGGRGGPGGRGGLGGHGGRGRNGGNESQGQRGGNRGRNSGPY